MLSSILTHLFYKKPCRLPDMVSIILELLDNTIRTIVNRHDGLSSEREGLSVPYRIALSCEEVLNGGRINGRIAVSELLWQAMIIEHYKIRNGL